MVAAVSTGAEGASTAGTESSGGEEAEGVRLAKVQLLRAKEAAMGNPVSRK
jgi:hypothetical protein